MSEIGGEETSKKEKKQKGGVLLAVDRGKGGKRVNRNLLEEEVRGGEKKDSLQI